MTFARRVALALLAVTTAMPVALVNASTSKITLHRVEVDVASSVSMTNVDPTTSVPPLLKLSPLNVTVPLDRTCHNVHVTFNVPRAAATLCAFGDTGSKRTILLIGDSQAAMWSPTLRAFGVANHWKIVMLAKSGCAPWSTPNPASSIIFETLTVAQCTQWNTSVVHWALRTHPQDIVMVGRGYPLGSNRDATPVLATLKFEMSHEVQRLRPSHARLIVVSPIPRFTPYNSTYTPSNCESIPGSLQKCDLSPARLIPSVELAAETYGARHGEFKLALITPLLCTLTRCTIVTKDAGVKRLMYFDGSHVNSYWAAWVSPAFATILQPLLSS